MPTWGVLLHMMSTGKVLPGMVNTGALPKKSENFFESSVALVTMSLKSGRIAHTCNRRAG